MSVQLSNSALLEISDLSREAERLSRGSASERARSNVLVQRISTIRQAGISSDEMRAKYVDALGEEIHGNPAKREERRTRAFHDYIKTGDDRELREIDLQAGQQSITWTEGAAGGYMVPLTMQDQIFAAMAQTDDLLSEQTCSFIVEPTPTLQPQQVGGFDLSTISASLVGEDTEQTPGSFPTVAGRTLRGNIIYKQSIDTTLEALQDIPDTPGKYAVAYGAGFARRLGQDAVTGNGTTLPQGIQTALSPIYTTGSGKITLTDIQEIYFSVNRVYRAQPKCAWLMSDSVYQRVRLATDNSGRPLVDVTDDGEKLMGKSIKICPSLGAVGGSPATNSTIIFGDLAHFIIRCSRPTLTRSIEVTGAIEYGRVMLIGRIRMDSALFDPSSGSAPPIVSATVTD